MQNILEKACQTLAGETNVNMAAASASYNNKGIIPNNNNNNNNLLGNNNPSTMAAADHHLGPSLKEFGPMNFPSFQDLNIYGNGGDQPLDLHQGMDRSSSFENYMQVPNDNNNNLCLGKKKPDPFNNNTNNGKSPFIWVDDHDHDLRLQDHHHHDHQDPFKVDIQIGPPDHQIDSISEIYESKPLLGSDISEKKFESTNKLDGLSPTRRNSPFG